MKISLNWLKDYVNIKEDTTLETISKNITESVAEIEEIQNQAAQFKNIHVGEVLESYPHPDADSLTVNTIQGANGEKFQIVCGANNMRNGIKVILATEGAKVRWHGEGDLVEMKPTKVRGVESAGMACAASEVGVENIYPDFPDGIVELPADAITGTPLAQYLHLDDIILDIDNHAITNRPDLFSHIGFARELVALELATWKTEHKNVFENISDTFESITSNFKKVIPEKTPENPLPFTLSINPELMSSYASVIIRNVKNTKSPAHIANRLTACGIRPLGFLVDLTNYIMLDLGIPMHAFDLRSLEGKSFNFRLSKQGEKVTTLDGQERELSDGIIVADDGEKIIDLCGIMGGLNSEIKPDTTDIYLHAPVYNKALIRSGMITLKHRTDAGTIYEKGIDPYLAIEGIQKSLEIIKTTFPTAKIDSKITDKMFHAPEIKPIEVKKDYLISLLGCDINSENIEKTKLLGFKVAPTITGWKFLPPTFRSNITLPADIAEEVIRLKGFDSVESTLPNFQSRSPEIQTQKTIQDTLRESLVAMSFYDNISFGLVGTPLLTRAGFPSTDLVEIQNPVSEDFAYFRPHLLPRLLENLERNIHAGRPENKIFEIGRYAYLTDGVITEKNMLVGLIHTADTDAYYTASATASELLSLLKVNGRIKENNTPNPYTHAGRTHDIIAKSPLAQIAEIHPTVAKNFDANYRIGYFMLDLDNICEIYNPSAIHVKPLPKYPSVERDFSAIFPSKTLAADILKNIQKSHKLITNAKIFDTYIDDNLKQENKKSIAISTTYQNPEDTLSEKDIKEITENITSAIQKSGGEMRTI